MRKRLLSLILAIVMILSFVPVYSFAEDETELSGAKIVYEFQQVGKSYNSTLGTDITAYKGEHTNGFWQGAFVHNVDGKSGTQGPHMNASYGLFMRYVGSWAAIKINVPTSGVYNKLSMKVHSIAAASTDIDVYIAPASTELSDSLDVTTLPVLAQNVDISKLYAQNSANTLGVIDADINKYIAAGEYYLIFKVEGGKYTDGKADSQSRIYTITLSGGDNAVPMNVKANMDTELLKIEETGNIELTGYLSDGNEFDVYLASLSFKSLDESIATVNESGEVTGVAEGKTKIIVSVTKNGSTFDAEVEVNVSSEKLVFSDYSLKYDFGYEIKDTTPFLSITGDETKNIWLPHSISSKISTLRKMSYGLQVGTVKDQYIVMTLNVPTSGTFRTKFGYALNSSGGSCEVYLLDGDTTDIAKAILNTKNRLGSFNCYGVSLVTGQSANFRNVTFEKEGEYLLVLRASGNGDGAGNGKSNNIYPSSITFYGGEETAVAGIVAEKKELLLEEGLAEKIDASVYLSDCTEAVEGDYTIEYKSADKSIATVDENGVVTAVSAGDTEVTITAKRGESSTDCVVRVSVIKPGYSAYRTEYDFSDADTDANGVIALEINVPATGSCDIILNHDKKPSGGVGEVYIISADTEDVFSALTEENKVGEADYFAETEENVDTPLGKYTFKMQGKYLVVLKTRETDVAQYPKKLILDGGSRAALMSVTLSFNGRNAKVVSGKMSDGTDADLSGAEISYGIKDLSVGSIDAKTGLVTATAEGGKTSITAVATLDGITVLGMLDVTLEGEILVPS